MGERSGAGASVRAGGACKRTCVGPSGVAHWSNTASISAGEVTGAETASSCDGVRPGERSPLPFGEEAPVGDAVDFLPPRRRGGGEGV